MEFFGEEWAKAASEAINTFPDDTYRDTKLFMYWDWITAARQGLNASWAVGVRDMNGGPKYVTFKFDDGKVASATVTDDASGADYVLSGDLATWKDIHEGYDAGKAVMYRRFRLEHGDVFRFFNRIYVYTEALVAMTKVGATL